MRLNFFHRMKAILAVAILMLSAGAAFADEPETPVNFRVMIPDPGVPEGFAVHWMMPQNSDEPDGFRFYYAEGITEDLNEFELFADLSTDDLDEPQRGMWQHYFMDILIGNHTFYVTAYNDDGESGNSNFSLYKEKDIPNNDRIRFTTVPESPAYKDVEYVYDADAESSDDDIMIAYELIKGPNGMEIDDESGVLTWTPDEAGFAEVAIAAFDKDNKQNMAYQRFSLRVLSCSEKTQITGEIKDKDGDIVNGIAALFTEDLDQRKVFAVQVENGEFTFDVDEGNYYLYYEGMRMYSEWYEGAMTPQNAKLIKVECGDIVEIDWTLKSKDDYEMVTVSGNVSEAENGDPLEGVFVEFTAEFDRNKRGPQVSFSTITDEDGNYSMEVPSDFDYIAGAFAMRYNHQNQNQYKPQFWELKDSPMEADLIELDGDREGINFRLEKFEPPTDFYSLKGNVENTDGEAITDAFVMAFNEDGFNGLPRHEMLFAEVDDNGNFEFDRIFEGKYIFFAFPMSADYAPGFYKEGETAVLSWEDATRVAVEDDVDGIEIILPYIEDLDGLAEMKGRIAQDGTTMKSGGDSPQDAGGVSGASVYLVNENGDVSKYAKTNDKGEYALANIPEGTYTFLVDKVGFRKYETTVAIGEDEVIDDHNVEMIPEDASTVIDVPNNTALKAAYPNPAQNEIYLEFEGSMGNSEITMFDMNGTEVLNRNIMTNEGANVYTLGTEALSSGQYVIRIVSGANLATFKAVIIR